MDGGGHPVDEPVLPGTEVYYVRSSQVADEFRICLGQCGAADGPVPVLLVTDTLLIFGTALEIARMQNMSGDLPPTLVVGIGYRGTRMSEIGPQRQRDFTPTVSMRGGGHTQDPAQMAGADRFLAFITDELMPWAAERYGADTGDSTLYGASFGGLFATHVLFSEPAAFRRYGIGSPSYWWDDGVMFAREERYAETHDDLPARVFVSVGAYENPAGVRHSIDQLPAERRAKAEAEEAADPTPDMVEQAERMVRQLETRRYPSLEIGFDVFPGETHASVAPLNISRSLRWLNGAPL
jgi:predicted alpha/beta superfamily hydrolase